MIEQGIRMSKIDQQISQLYGRIQHPYYIYAPRWINTSAGIKSLHYLCNSLNELGYPAFLILAEERIGNEPRVSGKLKTPILTQEIADAHFEAKLTPITFLSETIPGNPIGAPYVVRYLMNYVGALGGPTEFPSNEKIIAFSANIAERSKLDLNAKNISILFIPPIDPREIIPKDKDGTYDDFLLIYAGKYRSFIGKPKIETNERYIEVLREGKGAQNRNEVLELISKAKAVLSYENSSILTESVLAGVPGFFMPNEFLEDAIAEQELGWGGLGWGYSDENFEKAKSTLEEGQTKYYEQILRYFENLNTFVELTQIEARKITYETAISVPNYQTVINLHRLRLAQQILRSQGVFGLIRVTKSFILRRLAFKYWRNRYVKEINNVK